MEQGLDTTGNTPRTQGVGLCLLLTWTERPRPPEAWKVVLVLAEAQGFRELTHTRAAKDLARAVAHRAVQGGCHNLNRAQSYRNDARSSLKLEGEKGGLKPPPPKLHHLNAQHKISSRGAKLKPTELLQPHITVTEIRGQTASWGKSAQLHCGGMLIYTS